MQLLTCPTCTAPIDRAITDGDAYQCGRCATTATARLIETPDGDVWYWQQVRSASEEAAQARRHQPTTRQPA